MCRFCDGHGSYFMSFKTKLASPASTGPDAWMWGLQSCSQPRLLVKRMLWNTPSCLVQRYPNCFRDMNLVRKRSVSLPQLHQQLNVFTFQLPLVPHSHARLTVALSTHCRFVTPSQRAIKMLK